MAPIIILDEATSSVDPENQHALLTAINELTCGKTLIIIAHRLSTIKDADRLSFWITGMLSNRGHMKHCFNRMAFYRRL